MPLSGSLKRYIPNSETYQEHTKLVSNFMAPSQEKTVSDGETERESSILSG
jgi:hypothetical protein